MEQRYSIIIIAWDDLFIYFTLSRHHAFYSYARFMFKLNILYIIQPWNIFIEIWWLSHMQSPQSNTFCVMLLLPFNLPNWPSISIIRRWCSTFRNNSCSVFRFKWWGAHDKVYYRNIVYRIYIYNIRLVCDIILVACNFEHNHTILILHLFLSFFFCNSRMRIK